MCFSSLIFNFFKKNQKKLIEEFLNDPDAPPYFDSIESGLNFIRGHAGNFPSHYEELKECAQCKNIFLFDLLNGHF